MYEKTLRLLEFEAIRTKVAEAALSEEAAQRILGELPRQDPQTVAELKNLVSEVVDRINSGDEEKRDTLPDIGFLLPKLDISGASLAIDEAYGLGLFVDRGETLKTWLLKGFRDRALPGEKVGDQSPLHTLALKIPDCTEVSQEVFRVLDREGKLRDLPGLREINQRIRHLTRDLEALIDRYTIDENTRHILQSTVPSQRDGRIVLAVKANFRGRIKGIVHDVSSTGQTLFMEPGEVVKKNNDILIERRRLDAEILRVIREMTSRIAAYRQSLREFHEGIIYLETIRARARHAYETKGSFAHDSWIGEKHFADKTELREGIILKKARHPLLGSQAIPIDFSMKGDTKIVIITGPNTGGKTVTLKTVGLFALMNQFGLALPAEKGTALPVFDGVYADIGDEQSLSQSLSTFSAHMTNIAAITQVVTENSLVLLDELGSGTDPEEGSAIAMAILDYLMEKEVRLIATTHHSILKDYGYTREKMENASVEFDRRTLSPTYRILMGIPGESRAVDIAARNGLRPDIINRARFYLEGKRSDVSALIAGLKTKHQELRITEEMQEREETRLREERRKADLRELRIRQKEAELKTGSTGNIQKLLEESRKTLENLVREVKEGELTREKTLRIKEFLHNLEGTVAAEAAALERERCMLEQDKREFDLEHSGNTLPKGFSQKNPPISIRPGIEVLAGKYKRPGRVLRLDKKGSWIVEIGSLRMSFSEQDLHPFSPSKTEKKPLIAVPDLAEDTAPRFEISLRGMHLEDALHTLQRQLDAAVLSGLQEFSVIHGKGDGILQRGVHEFLKVQSQVADYYFSRPEMGGFGRTEVVLKA